MNGRAAMRRRVARSSGGIEHRCYPSIRLNHADLRIGLYVLAAERRRFGYRRLLTPDTTRWNTGDT